MKTNVIESIPEKMNGEPVFVGTRVPVALLFAELAGGHDYKYFLEDYPSVTEEQVLAVLKEAEEKLLDEYEILERVRELEETVLVQQAGLAEVLGVMLSLLPDEKGERLTATAAQNYVKTALQKGKI